MTHSATLTTMSFPQRFNILGCLILDTPYGIALSSNENRAFSIRFRPVNLKKYLRTRQKEIDQALDRYLPKTSTKPVTLHKAMRYSLFAGGKRLRPILCLAAAEACGGKNSAALPPARPLGLNPPY